MPGRRLERFARGTRASPLTPPRGSELYLAFRTRGNRGTGRGPSNPEPLGAAGAGIPDLPAARSSLRVRPGQLSQLGTDAPTPGLLGLRTRDLGAR